MNGKASVSKELDARHSKILEGLLKLPENRECADCKNKYASQNSLMMIRIIGTTMGKCEPGSIYMHAMFRNPSESWSAYFKAIGNEKSNKFWEAELPLNFDRSRIEKFIRTKYEEKRWAPKGEREPAAKTAETNHNINKFSEGVKGGVSRKPRALSLEDEIFTKHMSQITPPAMKSRTRSADLNMVIASPLLPPPLTELNTPATKTNRASEFYNLLYVSNGNKDHSIVPPSRWATFDCKTTTCIKHATFSLHSILQIP
ncbi:hypothetical protein Pint_16650 [Pistacia integerrima]|uniref:Uncharacterized protein n=1 Tax=Pistacia integerrima TaxID=434235 RepID=A0ACC0ZDL4_9ROSI|nr:hypothetical protein Pint_16650 [Pistacia integerrima]